MPSSHWTMSLLTLLGGLGIFVFAMAIMTDGLRRAAGPFLRTTLKKATRGRSSGVLLGTFLGFLVQSSATTVMLVGFINAGLISLAAAIPPILGANIGTTLSMQAISFRLGDYWFLPVIAGVILRVGAPRETLREISLLAIGFGLLFLGMNLMGGAVLPHRAQIAEWLAHIHGDTLRGVFQGIGISAAVTAIIQSSGATIGMCFALIQAGVFTDIREVFPLVLGAHIGTCVTALLASIGTTLDARRAALAHLFFNIFGAGLAVAGSSWIVTAVVYTSPDLLRQTANLHTATMLLAAAMLLPFTRGFAALVQRLVRSSKEQPPPSFLDEALLARPERALYAAIQELQRVARISARSFHLNAELMLRMDPAKVRILKRQEETIDEIQAAMKEYLTALTARYLSRRQALLLQHLDRCMTDIERIGDHNDNLRTFSANRHRDPRVRFDEETLADVVALFKSAERVLQLVIESLNPEHADFQARARQIIEARDAYVDQSMTAKAAYTDRIARHEHPAIVGMYLNDYIGSLDRIVRHSKMIALVESQPFFWIKRQKLDRTVEEMPDYPKPPDEKTEDFLHRLQSEGFV